MMTILPRRAVLLLLLLALPAPAVRAADERAEPGPLTARGRDNLTAFARLLSLVRFFHPSDSAAAADWNRVAVAGVSAVEGAADPAALARALEDFFRPLAPTLRVYPQGQPKPEMPVELRMPTAGGPFKIVAWRHYGGHFDGTSKVFHSDRIDDHSPPGFGTLVQAVAAGPFRGRRVRLRAEVRAEVQTGGYAQLGLRVDRAGGKPGFLDNMADRPIRDTPWRTYEIEGDVAADAERIVVLLVMTGGGKVWLDDVSIAPVGGGAADNPLSSLLVNGGFEAGETGRQPPGWLFPYESVSAGYHLLLRRGEPCRHGGCAELASDDLATPHIPRPEEVFAADLGGGAVALVPVSLWSGSGGTVPHARAGEPLPPWAATNPDTDADADTRAVRLAVVALVWGIQQHLNPGLDPAGPDWAAALPAALDGAARAADRESFRRVLRRMLLPLHDVRTVVVARRDDPEEKTLPLNWAWVESRLVVTGASPDAGVRPGDVITALDGRPAAEVLAETEALTPGPSPVTRRWLALELLAAGPAGSLVELGVERAGAPRTVTLVRERNAADFVADTPLSAVAEPRPGVIYLDLRRTSQDDFEKLVPRLARARGLVFDLRGGPDVSTLLLSHLAEKTVRSPNWQVPVVMQPDHRDMKWLSTFWSIEPKEPRFRGKVAFLTDGRATGYAETLLAMVESDRLGEIVGEPSGGDDAVPTWSRLPGGWTVTWSEGRTLKQDGSPFHGIGVKPTVPAVRTVQGIAAGRDEVVERAVEIVGR
jgi:C-terminal processing protease CtpA/Prc